MDRVLADPERPLDIGLGRTNSAEAVTLDGQADMIAVALIVVVVVLALILFAGYLGAGLRDGPLLEAVSWRTHRFRQLGDVGKDLCDAVRRRAGLPRSDAASLVAQVLEEITACLERGETVRFSSFGSGGNVWRM